MDARWKFRPVSFHDFRVKLASQMLRYSPSNQRYAGDAPMRANTVVPRRSRQKKKGEISKEDFNRAKRTRLCGDLSKLCNHVGSLETVKKPLVCAWCGLHTYTKCMNCKDGKGRSGIPLHLNPHKGHAADKQCFF